jgi:hypothetical protein
MYISLENHATNCSFNILFINHRIVIVYIVSSPAFDASPLSALYFPSFPYVLQRHTLKFPCYKIEQISRNRHILPTDPSASYNELQWLGHISYRAYQLA